MSITYTVHDEKRTMMNELQTPFASSSSSGIQHYVVQPSHSNNNAQDEPLRASLVVDEPVIPSAVLVPAASDNLSLLDAYILHLILGFFGALHFRMGRPKLGLVYLCTVGGFGLGYLVDFVRMPQLVRDYNQCKRENRKTPFAGNESEQTLVWDGYSLWLTGFLGIYQFYFGRVNWGAYYFCTAGGFGVAWLADLFRMRTLVHAANADEYLISDAYLLWFSPVGFFGAHYVYLGKRNTALLYLCTVGLFGVGWLVDMCRIPGLVRQANGDLLLRKTASSVVDGANYPIPQASLA